MSFGRNSVSVIYCSLFNQSSSFILKQSLGNAYLKMRRVRAVPKIKHKITQEDMKAVDQRGLIMRYGKPELDR